MIYKNFNSYYITIILFCLTINKTKKSAWQAGFFVLYISIVYLLSF